MTLTAAPAEPRARLLSPTYAATTIGLFALVAFVAFEATAVTTVMPTVAAELGGVGLYALSFAAPLASGVVGMVAAGGWSDRSGPRAPLGLALLLFSLGMLVCGAAPSMEVLVAGRVLQGLGGGAITVCLYVLVAMVFPPVLQSAVFATFAAAWVLPSLFGPALAALVADLLGWRWVFIGVVALVAVAVGLVAPAVRGLAITASRRPFPTTRLLWAIAGAAAVLAFELLGSRRGMLLALALVAVAVAGVAVRRLLPVGTLVAAQGLPAVIATRGLLSASFVCAEAYIVFVLQEQWGQTPGQAGIALAIVGVAWAAASQAQARLGSRVSDTAAMRWGTLMVLAGMIALAVVVAGHLRPELAVASVVVAGCGMGFGYPRTGVAMLAASDEGERGFNSSALSIADSLGAAFALSASGIVFAAATRAGHDPFLPVFVLAVALGLVGTLSAVRTSPSRLRQPRSAR